MEADVTAESLSELLEKWRQRVRTNQRVHYSRAEQLHRYNVLLGIPVVVLSALVGTSIFATLKQDIIFWARMAVGITSLLTAVIAGLQTFFKFSERASQHHAVAASYGAINRAIEAAQALPPTSAEETKELISELRKRMDELPKQAPAIPDRMWNSIRPHLTPDFLMNTGKSVKSQR
ncbi:MAG: SLATT domain-containing protein [Acidobacteriia bacterium]|nr:SLATT domain-containing protein [Terriglobia bacterium]